MWDVLDSSALSIPNHPAVPDPPHKHLSTPIQNSVPETLLSKLCYVINGIKLHKVYHSVSNRVVFSPLVPIAKLIRWTPEKFLEHFLKFKKMLMSKLKGKYFTKSYYMENQKTSI